MFFDKILKLDAFCVQITKKLIRIHEGLAYGNLELDKELKHIDVMLKAVNKFIVSVNSYITAFNNILK